VSRVELEKRILRLYKGGTGMGIVKIGKTFGIGTGLVQRVLAEQTRPFDVAEPYAYVTQRMPPARRVPVDHGSIPQGRQTAILGSSQRS
jgi:hypothetical protein